MSLLARQVLRRVALWSSLAVLVATGLGYAYVYTVSRDRALLQLQRHAELQGQQEEQAFGDAIAHLELFRAEFLRRYRDKAIDHGARYDAMYRSGPDGAIRLAPEYFRGLRLADGRYMIHTTGFVGAGAGEPDADLRRRLVIATDLVGLYGPAWTGPFANLHASLPENAMVTHWPGVPWGLNARPELDVTAGAVVAATLPANNPDRETVWSGMYFDLTARQWTVTVQMPVDDENGRHLVNPSHDILLDDILARLQRSRMAGARTLLVSAEGQLIAGPRELDEGARAHGVLHVDELADPMPRRIHAMAREHMEGGHPAHVMRDEESGAFVAFSRIAGPDWWLATIYDAGQVSGAAHRGAAMMLALGVGLQLILLVVVGSVLGRRVGQPVRQLQAAAERIARGGDTAQAEAGLPVDEDSEVGSLARSFRELARMVEQRRQELEATVAERTRELAEANSRLEQLTRTDSLTLLPNRRAFDADMEELLASHGPTSALALAMLDVDHFKPFNDTLGHEAGDRALREVGAVLASQSRRDVRCYRIGGEEFAIVFTSIAVPHAERILRRILEDVAALDIAHPASPLGKVTVSAGLAKRYDAETGLATLVRTADRQLYAAKASGRNRLAIG
ncbi:sensor domain-containing diguanylate cyclase [Arenimonas caeni]|jgi:diguanylate cyclase (GGDEF)-like protein|uniref:sensor domain-containing diguanylate cyclase n=1 Tax=Arenimonas caeni TaxID=2058085 RepID=UPI002A36687E|nr:diguanylate cyclase [Arenimonas caeni]MDY0022108.1 diguanylate cyclase [Arenimonas caeni]